MHYESSYFCFSVSRSLLVQENVSTHLNSYGKRGEITLIQATAVLGIICLRFEHQKARLVSNYSEILAVKFLIEEKAIYSSPSQIKKAKIDN